MALRCPLRLEVALQIARNGNARRFLTQTGRVSPLMTAAGHLQFPIQTMLPDFIPKCPHFQTTAPMLDFSTTTMLAMSTVVYRFANIP